ncbi:MAG TPA: serine/threonine-protein kinase [Phycisphaerae bacterium]|nr:serine/threonine-protein kinase [Phycisphaerae bacterium]
MNADNAHDRREGPLSERATEIQSPETLGVSIDLSIPRHVIQHPDAPQVAGYVLTELLGEGAYGQVWRSWQIRTRKEVAVKVFKRRGGLDWVLLQREVERLMRLDRHPHVVTLLDAGLEADPPYYVIDLLEGGSLQQFVDPVAPADPARVIAWAIEICDALAYVHRKGLIHCDLKPANILIDDEQRVRVVDFGQSRVFTESSAALGTLFFMAPEQAVVTELGKPVHPDVRWDIYAIGATLYSILTGRTPHATPPNTQALEGAASLADRLERYRSIIQADPSHAGDRDLISKTGPELTAVIAKCLAPNPEDRYESVAELRADLVALQTGRPVSPLAHRRGYRLRKFVRRNPFGVGLAAAVCVLALAGVLVRTLSVRGDERKARNISAAFVEDPTVAMNQLETANPRVKRFFSENAAEDLFSPAFVRRVMGARGALWANPDALWSSIGGGPLWRHGEWLEILNVVEADRPLVLNQIRQRAATGTDRQKYVAFCLIGQIAPKESDWADLCSRAAESESDPGVTAAVFWAAKRLGRDVQLNPGENIRVDDVSGLTFARITGCESFRRGSPPDEKDRFDNEVMPDSCHAVLGSQGNDRGVRCRRQAVRTADQSG